MIDIAKAVVAGRATQLTKSHFYEAMVEGGEELRKAEPKLTREQTFTRFATDTVGDR